MSQSKKLSEVIEDLRAGETKMKEGDHIGFGMLCFVSFLLTLPLLIKCDIGLFALVNTGLGAGIVVYYWCADLRERRSWYWDDVRRAVKGQEFCQMWHSSERGDWLLWFCAHMVGKAGWPTHQQIVHTSCQCARLALRHLTATRAEALRLIEATESWAHSEGDLDKVQEARRAMRTSEPSDAAYFALSAARGTAWAVDVKEDGLCFRFAQAASNSASDAAYAASYEVFDIQRNTGKFESSVRDIAKASVLKSCAEIVRRTLSVPERLTDELPLYRWESRWHKNSQGKHTGLKRHVPIALARKWSQPELSAEDESLSTSSALRWVSILAVFASVFVLTQALERNPIDYYTWLRWLVSSTACMLIWRGFMQGSLKWAYFLVPVVVIFNPVFPIHLKGAKSEVLETWHTLDIATATMLPILVLIMEIQLWRAKRRL